MADTDVSKIKVQVALAGGIAASLASTAWYLRGGMAAESSAMRESQTELRHEVEKMRLELTRDVRELTKAVDLGVSVVQAESWINLFRAELKSITVDVVLPKVNGQVEGTVITLKIGEILAKTVPNLPGRDGKPVR